MEWWQNIVEWFSSFGDGFMQWGGWGVVGASFAWIITSCLLTVGMIGCIIPVLPGHLLILIAAIAHHLMLGERSGVEWTTYLVLGLLLAVSQILEFVSGAAGSKWFGGTRWGSVGAIVGGLVGLFFFPIGLLAGPLIGAFALEWICAKRGIKDSTKSGVGSVFGTVTGLVIKAIVGGLMLAWFLFDAIWFQPFA